MNHWTSCWGNATSITDRTVCTYAKDITLRYPVFMPFSGSKLRLRFSNLTGTEPVTISKCVLRHINDSAAQRFTDSPIQQPQRGSSTIQAPITIPAGEEITSPEFDMDITAGETIEVSLYLEGFTQMNAGTLITGPLSRGQYAYGDFAEADTLPADLTRNTNWFYFLNTIDILTSSENHAIICYGDSITAQSWPDYLTLRAWEEGYRNIAIIRRAVSGTRILRQYDCITYAAYGLKGATRFPIEANVAGATDVIIQHGINDIIHPVGVEVNRFRPWSDMPTVEDLIDGTTHLYIEHARSLGLRVWSGTLLPIEGWRTYNEQRDEIRQQFNRWLRESPLFDGCIDFDAAVRDANRPQAFAPGFDSGDHLHPSETAYRAMAAAVPLHRLADATI